MGRSIVDEKNLGRVFRRVSPDGCGGRIGEAIGQSLTAFWLIAVSLGQSRHPRYGRILPTVGLIGGIVLLLGLIEGLATVLLFDPGAFGLAAMIGFLLLTGWLIWTGVLCILRPAKS